MRGDWGDQLVANDAPVTVEADAIAGYRDDALEEREGGGEIVAGGNEGTSRIGGSVSSGSSQLRLSELLFMGTPS